jgi:hypothetical protein
MNKRRTSYTGQDLWQWAEEKEAALAGKAETSETASLPANRRLLSFFKLPRLGRTADEMKP